MTVSMERRLSGDRRRHDGGPPAGWRDRRRSVERRQPAVGTVQVSEDDWERYFGNSRSKAATPAAEDTLTDAAAGVFGRIRD